ncbi:MAG: hypothetical protein WCE64_01240, partial [Bacteroidales bacterium]
TSTKALGTKCKGLFNFQTSQLAEPSLEIKKPENDWKAFRAFVERHPQTGSLKIILHRPQFANK